MKNLIVFWTLPELGNCEQIQNLIQIFVHKQNLKLKLELFTEMNLITIVEQNQENKFNTLLENNIFGVRHKDFI